MDYNFRSSLEKEIWRQVPDKTKRKVKYESEILSYVVKRKYTPDFIITNGKKKIYVEVKGYFRSEDMAKMIAIKAFNPELDIRFVFAKDNKVSKAKKLTYSDWCRKHNFPYAIGRIPDEWFK